MTPISRRRLLASAGIGAAGWRADGSRYLAGSAANLVRQPPEQKK